MSTTVRAALVLFSLVFLLAACASHAPVPMPEASLETTDQDDTSEPEAAAEAADEERECAGPNDCVADSIGPDCCPTCRNVAYTPAALEELRAHCSENPELRQSCPALGCIFEGGMATCHEGRCVVYTSPGDWPR